MFIRTQVLFINVMTKSVKCLYLQNKTVMLVTEQYQDRQENELNTNMKKQRS